MATFSRTLAVLLACIVAGPVLAAPGDGEGKSDLFNPLAGIAAELGSPVRIAAAVEKAAGGGPDQLVVTATLEEGWHLYSLEQKPGGPKPTRITVAEDSPLAPAAAFKPQTPPRRRTVEDVPSWKGLVVEEHEGTVVWRAPLAPNPSGTAAAVHGQVSLQLCRDNACTPPETIPFTAVSALGGNASPPDGGRQPAAAGGGTVTAGDRMKDGDGPANTVAFAPERSHLRIEAAFGEPRPAEGGGRAWPVVVELLPESGWHLYPPASDDSSAVGQGKPTIISLVPAAGPDVAGPRLRAARVTATANDGPITFEVLLEPSREPQAEPAGTGSIDAIIGFQTCTDSTCDPPWAVRLAVTPPQAGAAGRLEFADARYAEAARAPAAVEVASAARRGSFVGAGPTTGSPGAVAAAGAAGRATALSLPAALLMGLAGGLILNLMPCVLPVLGLKLMSFAQQSGRARREIFELNLWYCAGLYAVFLVLATASVAANIGLGSENLAWGQQFTSLRFNVLMCGIVFAFALSFLGVWELPIPGFIGERAGRAQSQEGPLGAFLKGVLSTVLATPCSGPFLGPVFGFTLSQPTIVTYAVFAAIATGMALPYLLVGLLPGLVRFLPRPGAWMETLKEVLGFVMLGTLVFLFTFLDHDYFVPTFAMLVGIWAACWWIGRAQQASAGEVGFGRWVQAAGVAALVGSLSFALLGPVASIIPWEPFSRSRLAELRRSGATVMVDFSADWCMTCKLNLATAIETDRVKSLVEANHVVPLLADWTEESPEIKAMLESLQSRSIPVLAIFPAEQPGQPAPEPIVLRDLITESQVLAAIRAAGPSRPAAGEIRARSAAAPQPAGIGR
jgi:thiol:disulfide interchange protein